MNRPLGLAAGGGFVACVLAANYVTTRFDLVPVAPGLTATAGTYFAGLSFVLRDAVQDTLGRAAAFMAIGIGGVLSFGLAAPAIALASVVAFVVSEVADLAVYTPMRDRGYVRAAVASNVVGAVADSVLFLAIAGFGLAALPGQLVGKLAVTLAVVLAVAVARRGRNVYA